MGKSISVLGILILVVASVSIPLAATTYSQEAMVVVFSASDPVGDDKGTGNYTYPTSTVFMPGVFDLTGFAVMKNSTHVAFVIFLRDLGGNPWGGPAGFCLQHVQVYVRTTASGTTNTSTYGLKVNIAEDYAWHYAILLAPGWGEEPVPQGQVSAIYDSTGSLVAVAGGSDFTVYTEPSLNAIVAVVNASVLTDSDNIANWKYVVTVSGYDGYEASKLRGVGLTAEEWKFGGADTYALAANVAPLVIDLLAPTAEAQYAMLTSYVVDPQTLEGTFAVVKGVPAPPPQPVTVTVTKTTTTVETRLTTTTTVVPTTVPEYVTDWTTTIVAGIILLVLGLLIGYVFFKKK
ncbi:MAG: glucodextranase DOMON-like domain-containing protein [Zestosphaera sp.]